MSLNKKAILARLDELSPQELKRYLAQELTQKRLGLTWETNLIDRDKALNSDLVFPRVDPELSHWPVQSASNNLIIEGDNFDSLRLLRSTHRGRIKVIYIDPPYNTGNRDFLFNDSFVDRQDRWRHSTWLEFMHRRLTIAKDLLAPDGVIFVSIDDIEQAHLSLLMDDVFPGMKVGTFVWKRRAGANDEKEWFLSTDHEYVLCYANPGFSFAGHKKDWSDSVDDGDPRGPWVDGPLNQGKDIRQRYDAFYPIHNPETDVYYPCDPDSVWRFASESRSAGKKLRTSTMETLIAEKRISWPSNEETVTYGSVSELTEAINAGTAPHNLRVYNRIDSYKDAVSHGECSPKVIENIVPIEFWVGKAIGYGKPRYKRFITDIKKKEKPLSTWVNPASLKKAEKDLLDTDDRFFLESGFTSEGTSQVSKIVNNKDFPYPKPLSLIEGLLSQATNPDADDIVLDFFAGSGTTGHAVLNLNDRDGGFRRFILCSSTEATPRSPDKNLCRNVTAARIRSVMLGYSYETPKGRKDVDGVGGSFTYATLDKISEADLMFDAEPRHAFGLLSLRETGYLSAPPANEPVWVVAQTSSSAIVLCPRITDEAIQSLKALPVNQLIVYSDRPDSIRNELEGVGSVTCYSIEQALSYAQAGNQGTLPRDMSTPETTDEPSVEPATESEEGDSQ